MAPLLLGMSLVTNNVTVLWIINLFAVLQLQHCVSDVVAANNCVALKQSRLQACIPKLQDTSLTCIAKATANPISGQTADAPAACAGGVRQPSI